MRGIHILYRLVERGSSPRDRTMRAHLIAVTLLVMLATTPAWAQPIPGDSTRTVHEGVFAAAQAERGRGQYESLCQTCHGADLSGGRARTLSGEDFMRNWRGLTLHDLFDRLQTMPPSASIRVEEETYLDILSFVLDTNGFPAGETVLTAEALEGILIQGAEGPLEVPDHSLVQISGCLTRSGDGTWLVTEATEPTRTRDPNSSAEPDLELADVSSDGGSFKLLYVFPSPDAMEGHLVEAKGFLIRGDQDALNVTSVSTLAPACR